MSDVYKIVLTACLTMIGSFLVLIFGRIFDSQVFEPAKLIKSTIGRTAWAVFYYADIYNSGSIAKEELLKEASKALRQQASDVIAAGSAIPLRTYWLIRVIEGIPTMVELQQASSKLIGISNARMTSGNNNFIHQNRTELLKLLRIEWIRSL